MSDCGHLTVAADVVELVTTVEPIQQTITADPIELTISPVVSELTTVVDVTEIIVSQVGSPGPQGPPGPSGTGAGSTIDAIAAQTINALSVVLVAPDGSATVATSADDADGQAVVGVALTAALTGESLTIALAGEVPSDAPLPVGPIYLAADGSLTDDPDAGTYMLRVGYAIAPDRLIVRFETPIFHA